MILRLFSPGWLATPDLSSVLDSPASIIEIRHGSVESGPLELQIDGLMRLPEAHEVRLVSSSRTVEVSLQGPGDASPSYACTIKASPRLLEDGSRAFQAIVSLYVCPP